MEMERNTTNHLKNHQPPAGNGDDDINPPPLPLKCPRCNSYNTKFCYYNNYSKAQPRYYCRACQRHWTHSGKQWNVPIGGKWRNMIPRILPVAEAPKGQVAIAQLSEIPSPLPPPSMIVNTSYVGDIFSHPYPPNQFCENLSLLQAMTFQSSRSPTSGNLLPTHQNLNNQPIGPWAPNMNTTGPSFAGEGPSFLDEAGPYFDVNQWENDEHQ